MQQIETETPDRSLAQKIANSRAKLEKLKAAADDAEAEAKRWSTAFEREPTPESHANTAIYQQRALNARKAAQAFEAETLQPLEAELTRVKREAIAKQLGFKERAIRERFETGIVEIVAGLRDLDGAISDLAALFPERLEASKQGVSLGQLSLTEIVANLNEQLEEFRSRNAFEIHERHARILFEGQSGPANPVRIEVNLPTRQVPSPLR